MSEPTSGERGSLLVVSAHAGDFAWRAGGAIALGARFLDAGDYPLVESREPAPTVVLTHTPTTERRPW